MFEWLIMEVCLHTRLFTGPTQFLIQLVFCGFLPDLLLSLYCPCMWIRASSRAGWGRDQKMKRKFFTVRKQDPREELIRQGYFRNKGKFAYVRHKTDTCGTPKSRANDSTYLITAPSTTGEVTTRQVCVVTNNNQRDMCTDISEIVIVAVNETKSPILKCDMNTACTTNAKEQGNLCDKWNCEGSRQQYLMKNQYQDWILTEKDMITEKKQFQDMITEKTEYKNKERKQNCCVGPEESGTITVFGVN